MKENEGTLSERTAQRISDRFSFTNHRRNIIKDILDDEFAAVQELLAANTQIESTHTALLEAAKQMSCTCSNPDGSWPHNENNAECNLTIAAAAIALAEKDQPSV